MTSSPEAGREHATARIGRDLVMSGHPRRGGVDVLVVSARDLGGRATGRVSVLRGMLRTLQDLGYEVGLVTVSRRTPQGPPPAGVRFTRHVRPRALPLVAAGGLLAWATRRRSLNEVLFDSPRLRAAVRDAAQECGADVVVCDTLRLDGAARATGLPYILDLDDLFSRRYAEQVSEGTRDGRATLGYVGEQLPPLLRRPAGATAAALLGHEARVIGRRERELARQAPAVAVASSSEAAHLAAATGRFVHWLPPTVWVPDAVLPHAERTRPLMFLGGLDYQANVDGVRWYRDEVLAGATDLPVTWLVGHCPEHLADEIAAAPGLEPAGYVDDLGAAMQQARVLVAPIVTGTGIKTKVLEAMGQGLAVVGTPLAFEGIAVEDGTSAVVCPTGRDMREALRGLVGDPGRTEAIGAAAREVVMARFTSSISQLRWQAALTEAQAATPDG